MLYHPTPLVVSGVEVAAPLPLRRRPPLQPRQLRASHYRVRWTPRQPLRVVQLTDLHVGWGTPLWVLEQALEATRAARPDLVVLTGDYVNRTLRLLPALETFLRALPRPCIATLGNHDHWSGAAQVERTLERSGVRVLRNGHRTLTLAGHKLTVVGVDDGASGQADVDRAFHGLRHPGRALVLTHDPRTAAPIALRGGRLILAGHTHGGQLNIPLVTPGLMRLGGNRYVAGWYKVGRSRLYVSTGLGSAVVRVRVGNRAAPEIAVLDLF